MTTTLVEPKAEASLAEFAAVDLSWEQAEEDALRAFHAYDADGALANWQRGIDLAEACFAPIDPRLATSLTNYGFAIRRLGEHGDGERCLRRALEVWQQAWYWIELMTLQCGPIGSHPSDREWFDLLAERGYAATWLIWRHDQLPANQGDLWTSYRPRRAFGARKLMAAVLLLASRPR